MRDGKPTVVEKPDFVVWQQESTVNVPETAISFKALNDVLEIVQDNNVIMLNYQSLGAVIQTLAKIQMRRKK